MNELLEDPSRGRKRNKKFDANVETRMHIIGVVSKGHILGLEEAIIGKSDVYSTSAICWSQNVELLRIERDVF